MTNRPLMINPHDALRKPSQEVLVTELESAEIQTLIDDLIDTMKIENGIGIAAPQIGIHKRIIIVHDGKNPQAYVNPMIISRSFRTGHYVEEGCLSVPGVWGFVTRHKSVKVKALDRHGARVTVKARDLESIIFQHEIEHLDGILFIDKVDVYTRRHGIPL